MITCLLAWGKKTVGSTDLMHAWFSRCAVEPSYDFLMRRLSFMETHVQRSVGYEERSEDMPIIYISDAAHRLVG